MPPACCQHAQHSACLNPKTPLCFRAMDNEELTSRGSSKPELSTPRLAIQWQNDRALTDTLVIYLTTHAANCRVLFYSDSKKAMPAVDDNPTGLDKGQIYHNIVRLLFAAHPKLRGKYKKLKASFTSTGAGVMPAEGTGARNLLDTALSELPWYIELDAIWHSNPSMATRTYSSKPGIDHTSALYALFQPHGGAGPATHFGATQWSPHHGNAPAASQAPTASHAPTPSHDPAPSCAPSHASTPSHGTPYDTLSHFHLPSLPLLQGNIENHYNTDYNYNYNDDNEAMMVDKTTGSPPCVAGKKRQLPSSPSPPLDAPEPFYVPEKSSTSSYNNRSAFNSQKPSSRGEE
ncbi:hypothetical protein BDR07DRAFT_1485470 [Suillus spraguei]|nr:hypothetical protein BDR07DRAFT_1485470 [Suillus spraguei]